MKTIKQTKEVVDLCELYEVEDVFDLVIKQADHIRKLQNLLNNEYVCSPEKLLP